MNLIENWKKAPAMFSVQCQACIVAVISTWTGASAAGLTANLPPYSQNVVFVVIALLGVGGIIGRLIDQPAVK